jgi:general secretion pathway protein F
MSFVMPKVIGIFRGMELTLPLSTRVLIWTTDFMKQFWWLVALGLVSAAMLTAIWIMTERGRRIWDRVRLRLPLLGALHHKSVIARFSRTLSTLLASGIPLVESLDIARLSMGNRIMEDAVGEAAKSVGEGADLSTPLRKTERFPPLVTQLVKAGEQSGELEEMLAKAAEVYEEDVDSTIGALTSIVEPAVILFMGLMVAYMVMAILIPIFDMTSGIK